MYVRILFEASTITEPRVWLAPHFPRTSPRLHLRDWISPKSPLTFSSNVPRTSCASPLHLPRTSPRTSSRTSSLARLFDRMSSRMSVVPLARFTAHLPEPIASRASSNTLPNPLVSTESYYGNASSYGNSHPHSFDCYASLALQTKRQKSKHSWRWLQFGIRLLLLECRKNISIISLTCTLIVFESFINITY